MKVDFNHDVRRRVALAVAAIAIGMASGPVTAQAPAAPERLSWYGDPKAPNLSGIWIRVDDPVSKSREGWLPWPPPLKPPFAAIWSRRMAAAAAGARTDDPVVGCLPPGMPRFMSGSTGPLQIVQTPGRVILYRDGAPVRRVWLDGRQNPKPPDLEAFSNGNAIGRYEGVDLVTEVVGVKSQPIDGAGVPHSEKLRIVERFHRLDEQTLKVDITLTDPDAYTRPMTTTVTYRALDDPLWEPREFICTPKTDYHPDAFVH